MSLGGSIRPSEHPVPGAGPLSSQRPRTLARHLGFALNQAVGGSSGGQFAITSSIPLSALRPKSCLAGAAARPNPHRRQTIRRFPRVRSSGAFGRRPLHRPINHAGPASEILHEKSGRAARPRFTINDLFPDSFKVCASNQPKGSQADDAIINLIGTEPCCFHLCLRCRLLRSHILTIAR